MTKNRAALAALIALPLLAACNPTDAPDRAISPMTRTAPITSTAPAPIIGTPTATIITPTATPFDPTTLAPCASDDGEGAGSTLPCYWDAATRGNGQGDSFMIDATGEFIPLP